MPGGKDVNPTEEQPFRRQWLNSCYQETLLPDAPWHGIESMIAGELAKRVEKQFIHPERREALLEVLGPQFVETYLSKVKRDPRLLEPPNMVNEEKQKLITEAQSWLTSQMYKAVKDVGYQKILNGSVGSDEPPPGYSEFMQHTYGVFVTGLDRQCYLQEQELTNQKQKEMSNKKKGLKDALYKVPAPSRFKPASSATSASTIKSSKPSSSMIKSMVHKVEGDPPPLWGVQSDALGSSIVAILERDPRKFDHVASRLHGRQMPGKLRSFMWADVLLRTERKRMKEVYAEKLIRERFAQGVSRGLSELRLKRATLSPINGLIENTVIETYTKTTSMIDHKDTNHMKEAARTLNVLYVYDRSYEPYLVHWLFPLQIAFRHPGVSDDKGEHVFELAMYLDLLNSTCFPKWPQVFAIADQVMNTLRQADPQLHDHLTNIAKKNFKVNPKEFLVQLIHEEKSKAEALYQTTPGTLRSDVTATELLANPLIFFRRWIGEGFVSVLDTPGVMYIWDQCFMQGWQDSVLLNTCLSLVELLRHKFMDAKDYMDMKEVFLNEPCKLYTCDLQAAWIHLEGARDLNDIPFQNRQRPVSPVTVRTPSAATNPHPGLLHPFGIKDVRAKLIIPVDAVNKEPRLAQVDPNHLRLFVHLYFGSVKLRSRMSLRSIEVAGFKNDAYGNAVYELFLPKEKFVFENIDLSQYDVERELGSNPHAILRLVYSQPEVLQSNSISVGWARVPLFRRGAGSGRVSADPVWVILAGEQTFTLHPGDFTETSSASMPKTPSERGDGHLIGYNSELTGVVYDPRDEPADNPLPIAQVPPMDTRVTPRQPPPRHMTPRKTPVPELTSPTPEPSETEQESDQAPTPVNLVEDHGPWVNQKPEASKRDPAPSTNKQPFDLYVDGLRFIPDNASIVKITGRILRTGEVGDVPDILALPDLAGPARSPQFHYRLQVNVDGKTADPNMLVLLRAYTVDIITQRIVIIGSCLFGVFDAQGKNKGKLRVGGHQLRLRSGVPDTKKGVDSLTPASLDHAPEVPGCSLLIRLRPRQEKVVEAPKYTVGYYKSGTCKPNNSETRIFASYADNMNYPAKERDMVKRLQQMEDITHAGQGDVSLLTWLKERLDIKKQSPSNVIASNLNLTQCVRYHKKMGLFVKMTRAFGMPDNMFIQCFVRSAPGRTVLDMDPTPEGYGKEEKFLTRRHIYESFFQAPAWADEPKEIHPFYDSHSCLLVQVFGLEIQYKMKQDHKSPGRLLAPDGSDLELKEENLLGWSVVPLFYGNSVLNGTHRVPILKNKPTAEILEQLSKSSAASVLERNSWNTSNSFESGSLLVTLWDGHYDLQEVPEMPVHEDLLEKVGDLERYREAQQIKVGRHLNSIVFDSLEPKYKKQGSNGAVFKKEMQYFEDLMSKTFYDLIENQLLTAGDRPLS